MTDGVMASGLRPGPQGPMPRSQIPRARGSKMLSGCKVRPAYDRDCVGPSAEKQKMVQFDPKSVRIVCLSCYNLVAALDCYSWLGTLACQHPHAE